jgi:two-component system phosphate regulon sensor histidine kinase PhoR
MTYVKDIVDAHKGKIKVDSSYGKGSVFVVDLPLA